MNLLVVGAGDVGRWLARVVDADVAFADADPAVAAAAATELADDAAAAETAERSAAGDRTVRDVPLDTDETFDAVCVAVPLPAARAAIAEHAGKAERAVIDVTGAMVEPLAAMADAAPGLAHASLHPLFAPAAAPGRVAVCRRGSGPAGGRDEEPVVDRVLTALEAAGNELVPVDADDHDEAMRTVQGRAHAAVLAFALASRDADVPPALATPVYEQLADLVGRVTGNNARVYADVQSTFGGADDVAAAAEALAAADPDRFAALYETASETAGRERTDGD